MSIHEARELLEQAHWDAIIRVRNYVTEKGVTNNAHRDLNSAREAEVEAAQALMDLTQLENDLMKMVKKKEGA